jgi:hypothetical protein
MGIRLGSSDWLPVDQDSVFNLICGNRRAWQ